MTMGGPLVAIIGRLSSYEFDQSPVREVELLRQGLRKMGKVLADSGFRILVFTNEPKYDYAARYVVDGFRESRKKRVPESIIIKRAKVELTDRFPEESTDTRYRVEMRAEEPWEMMFYFSLFEVDAVVVVGNGNFTYFGGLHAVGSKMPILALGGFGGVATKILELLKNRIPEKAYNCMAETGGDERWAQECVATLRERIEKATQNVKEVKEEKELRNAVWAAFVVTAIFVILLAGLAEFLRSAWNSWLYAYSIAFVPAVAGFAGAILRLLFAQFKREEPPYHQRSFWLCGALGFSAGGLLGALYTSTQLKMISSKPEAAIFVTLFMWAMAFGCGVGFSLDRAFNRLLVLDQIASSKAPQRGSINAQSKSSGKKSPRL